MGDVETAIDTEQSLQKSHIKLVRHRVLIGVVVGIVKVVSHARSRVRNCDVRCGVGVGVGVGSVGRWRALADYTQHR